MDTVLPQFASRLQFHRVQLTFEPTEYTSVFKAKNNKSLAQTIAHRRYSRLAPEVRARYTGLLQEKLGSFLLSLKEKGDDFYLRFLNAYGDLTYSIFRIEDFLDAKGVYAYVQGSTVVYVGRCRDSMKKRINQGYGKIHPKNCYLDGQATNCHLNSRITKARPNVSLWLHPMSDDEAIVALEKQLIRAESPIWNIQR